MRQKKENDCDANIKKKKINICDPKGRAFCGNKDPKCAKISRIFIEMF